MTYHYRKGAQHTSKLIIIVTGIVPLLIGAAGGLLLGLWAMQWAIMNGY